jgi:chaperonin GroEL
MAKQLVFSDEARNKIRSGVDKLADAVSTTLGPKGRNVALDKGNGLVVITKDGVSVARDIELEDPFENMGAQLVKSVSSKTADVAGDGTTTATVLAQQIYTEGLKNVIGGANPISLKRGIDKAVAKVTENLCAASVDVKDHEQISQVAAISANGDSEIGGLIADAIEAVGKDGTVTVGASKTIENSLDVVEGMQFINGYISPYFVNKAETMTAELVNPFILCYDGKLQQLQPMLPLLNQVAQQGQGRPLLILAEDFEGEALSTLIMNHIKGSINCCLVKSPGYGDQRKDILGDIATLVGATHVTEESGIRLENPGSYELGTAAKVVVNKGFTTIVDGGGDVDAIEDRVSGLKLESEHAKGNEATSLKFRIAKLTGGVAVINIGASTEVELKEKKDRVDDALAATRAAVDEGIVPGGGVALIKSASGVKAKDLTSEEDEQIGAEIVLRAVKGPLKKLVENAGGAADVVINDILKKKSPNAGYNVATGEYVDMIQSGILDPTKVTRSALQNAASVAGLLLTTECLITDIPQENAGGMPMLDPRMMGGMPPM